MTNSKVESNNEQTASAVFLAGSRRLTLLGTGLIGATLGLFGLWAALAPLDEGVVSPGVVQLQSKRKPIQHPATGVIDVVYVKEGDFVKAGTPLVQLDDTQVDAAYLAARSQFLALMAAESRLRAEGSGALMISFDPILELEENRGASSELMAHEKSMFVARKAALAADVSVLQQSVLGSRDQQRALAAQLEGLKNQGTILAEQLKASRRLAEEGFISRTKLLDEERVTVDMSARHNELLGNLDRARTSTVELQLRIAQRQRDFAREVSTSAVEVRRDIAVAAEKLAAAKAELKRTKIVSPVDGMVVGLAIQAHGAVVPEGVKIMDIVPLHDRLLIEAHVSPDVIDRVHVGLPADVRFSSFSDLPWLAIEGRVLSISADRIEAGADRPPYFLALVEIAPAGLQKLGRHRIQPGMAADVIIKTGERTLLAYLIKPLSRRVAGAMTER